MEILVKQSKITNSFETFGTELSNFNLHFLSFCFPKFLIENLPNKCFIFNMIANFYQNLQAEDFIKICRKVVSLYHVPNIRCSGLGSSACFRSPTFLAAELGVWHVE